MDKIKIHTYRGEKNRSDAVIQQSNSFVYSELSFFEEELYSGHYGIKLPINDKETYVIEGQVFDIESVHFLLTNPNHKTEVIVKANKPVSGICIGLTECFLKEVKSKMQQDAATMLSQKQTAGSGCFEVLSHCYSVNSTKPLARFLKNIKQRWLAYGHLDDLEENQFYYDLSELIIRTQLEVESSMNQLRQNKTAVKEEIYRRVDVMNQYIYDNFQNTISIDDLSKIACLSKYHAIRCFQEINGISPYQKIMALRIQKAKSLLKKGHAVSETANLCGFTDYRGFSKYFKKKAGISPSAFQKRQ